MRRMRWYYWLLAPLFMPLVACTMLALVIADVLDPNPDMDKLYPQQRQHKKR